ncbi:hypothetical protein [Catenulispora rubra]|uniref:hypothetical protein n=1 Tax=Catenulispora rubra TaxID=280293 RepID=UPI001892604E|nr:hypothetical protein [Catenulispora rubra]
MNFRDRLSRRPRRPRAFSLATELRVLAVGLFAVAGGALLLSESQPVAPSEVAGAALVVVAVTVLNIAVGLRRARRAADAVER